MTAANHISNIRPCKKAWKQLNIPSGVTKPLNGEFIKVSRKKELRLDYPCDYYKVSSRGEYLPHLSLAEESHRLGFFPHARQIGKLQESRLRR